MMSQTIQDDSLKSTPTETPTPSQSSDHDDDECDHDAVSSSQIDFSQFAAPEQEQQKEQQQEQEQPLSSRLSPSNNSKGSRSGKSTSSSSTPSSSQRQGQISKSNKETNLPSTPMAEITTTTTTTTTTPNPYTKPKSIILSQNSSRWQKEINQENKSRPQSDYGFELLGADNHHDHNQNTLNNVSNGSGSGAVDDRREHKDEPSASSLQSPSVTKKDPAKAHQKPAKKKTKIKTTSTGKDRDNPLGMFAASGSKLSQQLSQQPQRPSPSSSQRPSSSPPSNVTRKRPAEATTTPKKTIRTKTNGGGDSTPSTPIAPWNHETMMGIFCDEDDEMITPEDPVAPPPPPIAEEPTKEEEEDDTLEPSPPPLFQSSFAGLDVDSLFDD